MNFEDRVGPQDETAGALFAAARSYRPPARARRRALRALGLPVGIALLASSAAQGAVALLSGKGVVVLAVVAVAGAAAVGGAVHVRAVAPRSLAKPSRALAVAKAAPPAPVATVVWVPAETMAGSAASPTAATTRSMTRSTAAPASISGAGARARGVAGTPVVAMQGAAPLEPSPVAESVSSLRAELRLIGEARGNLRAGDARGALLALDEHARRFPAGAMVEEVELLRMRALVAAGDGESARGLGGDFLARRPHSPLAGAVRALFGFPNPRGLEGDRR
ncbi:MAG TPA: hypothetical protein VFH68_22750 [Polyangia bacterium]|nr:hypothetical protein [Polyangia bacterium]